MRLEGRAGWTSHNARMLAALLAGIAVGLALPGQVSWLEPAGTLFVEMLKTIMLPIVVCMLVVAVGSLPQDALGQAGRRILGWGLAASLSAAGIGVLVAAAIQPGAGLSLPPGVPGGAPARPPGLLETLVPGNVVEAAAQGNLVGVLFFAGVFALALNQLRRRGSPEGRRAAESVLRLATACSEALAVALRWIMLYAPVGVFALTAVTFSRNGPRAVVPFLKVHVAMDLGMLLIAAAGLLALRLRGVSPSRFVRAIQTPAITAFSTNSSAATLPAELACARDELGLPVRYSGFAIPIAVSLVKVGSAVFLAVMAVFAANAAAAPLTPGTAAAIVTAAFVASIATAPISGGAMVQLAVVFQQAGLPLGAIPIVAAIPFAGKLNTVVNVAGHLALATAVGRGVEEERDDTAAAVRAARGV